MIYRDGGDRWIDESLPTQRNFIAEGTHAAEDSARRFGPGAALDCLGGTYNVVDDEPVTARDNVAAMAAETAG